IGEMFNRATTIDELVVRSDERQILWKSLRDRLAIGENTDENEESHFSLDPVLMQALIQWIDLPHQQKNKQYRNGSQPEDL
ncbi:MAG TPA: hypothetical protein VF338_12245, partial [Leptolinea sp.]